MSEFIKEDININDLVDIKDVSINPKLDRNARLKSFMDQIKNPLCYKYGDYIIKVSFSEGSDRTMEDCFKEYLKSL